jgi:chromosome segregation ATPase
MAPRASPQKTDVQRATKVLRSIEELQSKNEITILKISEPISNAIQEAQAKQADDANSSGLRTSDVSNPSAALDTPAALEADLAHFKELFAKLRFSYVEQVTKEKFIRAIVGDPPLIVSAKDNQDLEEANRADKARLKALKTEVADMVADLEARGRELARRHDRVQSETSALRELPAKIAGLEEAIARLKEEQEVPEGARPEMHLPLAKTAVLVDERKAKIAELDRQLEQLAGQVPRKRKDMERLQTEVGQLETKRQNSTAAAREAKRRKEAALGGVEDDLEERGRWWRASEAALQQMLDIKS